LEQAMDDEILALPHNTWILTDLPPNEGVIYRLEMVCKTKT
jgi:hypothetical protein